MTNFWKKLQRPFSVLAPMEEVTDAAFRQMVLACTRPDVFFTEFVNVDALNSPGRDEAMRRLKYQRNEKPIVAQIWGTNSENFEKAARDIRKLGFDGIDINMGCPQKKVVKTGAGAALINDPQLAADIIAATRRGAGPLPVSVKTRIGYKSIITEEWIGHLLRQKLDALTVHVRTQKEMSKVPAHYEEFKKIIKLRNEISPRTIIIGNGDIKNAQDGIKLCKKYNLDGYMIGRGVFKDIYCFKPCVIPDYSFSTSIVDLGSRFQIMERQKPSISGMTEKGRKGYRKDKSSTRDYVCSDNIVRGNPRTNNLENNISHNSSPPRLNYGPVETGRLDSNLARTIKNRLELALRHIDIFEKTWGGEKNPQVLKKYMKIYISGFSGASILRADVMTAEDIDRMRNKIRKNLNSFSG